MESIYTSGSIQDGPDYAELDAYLHAKLLKSAKEYYILKGDKEKAETLGPSIVNQIINTAKYDIGDPSGSSTFDERRFIRKHYFNSLELVLNVMRMQSKGLDQHTIISKIKEFH